MESQWLVMTWLRLDFWLTWPEHSLRDKPCSLQAHTTIACHSIQQVVVACLLIIIHSTHQYITSILIHIDIYILVTISISYSEILLENWASCFAAATLHMLTISTHWYSIRVRLYTEYNYNWSIPRQSCLDHTQGCIRKIRKILKVTWIRLSMLIAQISLLSKNKYKSWDDLAYSHLICNLINLIHTYLHLTLYIWALK